MSDDPDPDRVAYLLDVAVSALGGQRRDGQMTMARSVVEAARDRRHLLVQAGTGTGKSLAYLVPAAEHVIRTGKKVVISTATLALQRQVVGRDLPLVLEALEPELGARPTVALLKGWNNYLCVHKVAGGYPDDATLFDAVSDTTIAPESLGAQVVRAREWADISETGDRDDLVPGITDRAWRQVSVTRLECLGRNCPMLSECFAEQAREVARDADLVVTNHSMVAVAASGAAVLPEHDLIVIDEAHEFADRVTEQASGELSAGAVDHAARVVRRLSGLPTDDLDTASRALAQVLVAAEEGRFADGLPEHIAEAVATVRDAARTLLSALRQGDSDTGRHLAVAALLEVFEVAERMVSDPSETFGQVLWCERTDRGGSRSTSLRVAPLSVAGLVRSQILGEPVGILTSATLSLGGSFESTARSVGLASAESDDSVWRGIDVGSPFDYQNQGICYIARHLPPPGREPATEAQLDEIEGLIRAAGGRTLGLFSSRRAAVAAAEALRPRLEMPILVQGEDQLPTLVSRFAAEPETCLFGTLSLWQGVDVPGPTCRLVIIDRIPFPRPDDPIATARSEAVAARGGNGFMAVAATHAALLLAQGAGRLIRTDRDRGVVAVLDPRLATARYGEFLARSMPPMWRTTRSDVVLGALRRLAAQDVLS